MKVFCFNTRLRESNCEREWKTKQLNITSSCIYFKMENHQFCWLIYLTLIITRLSTLNLCSTQVLIAFHFFLFLFSQNKNKNLKVKIGFALCVKWFFRWNHALCLSTTTNNWHNWLLLLKNNYLVRFGGKHQQYNH